MRLSPHIGHKAFSFLLLGLASGLMVACSTIQSRIQDNPDAFYTLSTEDQELVLGGNIREGFSRDAVFIAWGRPDEEIQGQEQGAFTERWIYLASQTDVIPDYMYVTRYDRGRRYVERVYDPIYIESRYPYRSVTFRDGRVVAWESFTRP